jgi:hypothetical protein
MEIMTLEEFAKDAGVEVFECGPGWDGKYGYKEKDWEGCRVNGFRTPLACYKNWLECKVGKQTAKAILKLLRRAR